MAAPVPVSGSKPVVALGNFDGFHRGHQAVLERAMTLARATGAQLVVATFDPHPVRYFRPEMPGFLLTTIPQRSMLFSAFGADSTVAIPFDEKLAALSPDAFVEEWLSSRLNARAVVTGANFKFGCHRSGNTTELRKLCAERGIMADVVDTFEACGGAASSTRVRQHLMAGEIERGSALMGRPYVIQGAMERCRTGARNVPVVSLAEYLSPMPGTYSALLSLPNGRTRTTIVEVRGPTGGHEPCICLADLPQGLATYGQTICVELGVLMDPSNRRAGDCDGKSLPDYPPAKIPVETAVHS